MNTTIKPSLGSWIALMSLTLAGCSMNDTSISLNERVLYQPDPIAQISNVIDRKLAECINASLEKNNMSSLADVQHLDCSNQQIVRLEGIEQLKNLKTLNLSNNFIDNTQPLASNLKLEEVYLRDNRLRRVDELLELPKLFAIKLNGNQELACGSIPRNDQFLQIEAPRHCR